jgi:hypothetical protein
VNGLASVGSRLTAVARVVAELVRHRPLTAPAIAAKALLARGIWGIDAPTFLMLGMHRQPVTFWTDSMRFRGGLEPVLRALNWRGDGKRLTVDKLMTAERLASAGIPAAPLLAVIGRDAAAHEHGGRFPQWTTVAQIADGLAGSPDRLFIKPATGWRGDGVMGPERHDGRWVVDGMPSSDRELAERLLKAAPPAGLLVQERLRSHTGLAPIGGALGLGTVRINTALTDGGAELLFALGKIMGSECLVDNFSGGKFGNLLARVDPESGRLTSVWGRKPGQRFLLESVPVHPVTGSPLIGFQLPLWREAVQLAKRVAAVFPEAPLVGVDVAITDDGPLAVEVQSDWDASGAQLSMNEGLRPVLVRTVPRLAVDQPVKQQVLRHLSLSRRAQNREGAAQEPRTQLRPGPSRH